MNFTFSPSTAVAAAAPPAHSCIRFPHGVDPFYYTSQLVDLFYKWMAQNVNAIETAAIVQVKFVCTRKRAKKNVQRLKHELKQRPIASSVLSFILSFSYYCDAQHHLTQSDLHPPPLPSSSSHFIQLLAQAFFCWLMVAMWTRACASAREHKPLIIIYSHCTFELEHMLFVTNSNAWALISNIMSLNDTSFLRRCGCRRRHRRFTSSHFFFNTQSYVPNWL